MLTIYIWEWIKPDIKLCPHCKMVLNRDEAIFQAAETVKWRKKKFFVTTYDGVSIASRHFYEIYHKHEMNGIEFIPFKNLRLLYLPIYQYCIIWPWKANRCELNTRQGYLWSDWQRNLCLLQKKQRISPIRGHTVWLNLMNKTQGKYVLPQWYRIWWGKYTISNNMGNRRYCWSF